MVEIDRLISETVNEATEHIDELDALGIVTLIHEEDKKVAGAVESELPRIAEAVEAIADRFARGGRIIYCGAGSSGRLGVLDAVELTPTYSVSPEQAFGLLAGGKKAMYEAVEGAEDSKELAVSDLEAVDIKPEDCIIGIAASGRTPYTIAALEFGRRRGCLTVSLTCNEGGEMAKIADISIAPVVGPEAVSGSTRMKAGTAQKMVVNMLSTAVMIRLGKVYQNYMVQVRPTNEKLMARAARMIAEITGIGLAEALLMLEKADRRVDTAVVMTECGCKKEEAEEALVQAGGYVRKALELAGKNKR